MAMVKHLMEKARGQPDIGAEEHGFVTSEEPESTGAGEGPDHVEPCKCMERNDLEMESGEMRELLNDVTPDVTPEGASHDFATDGDL
jgi:hypothetical protein